MPSLYCEAISSRIFRGWPTLVVQSVKCGHKLTDIEQPTGLERLRALRSVVGARNDKPGTIEDPILDSSCVHIGLLKVLESLSKISSITLRSQPRVDRLLLGSNPNRLARLHLDGGRR